MALSPHGQGRTPPRNRHQPRHHPQLDAEQTNAVRTNVMWVVPKCSRTPTRTLTPMSSPGHAVSAPQRGQAVRGPATSPPGCASTTAPHVLRARTARQVNGEDLGPAGPLDLNPLRWDLRHGRPLRYLEAPERMATRRVRQGSRTYHGVQSRVSQPDRGQLGWPADQRCWIDPPDVSQPARLAAAVDAVSLGSLRLHRVRVDQDHRAIIHPAPANAVVRRAPLRGDRGERARSEARHDGRRAKRQRAPTAVGRPRCTSRTPPVDNRLVPHDRGVVPIPLRRPNPS